MKKERSSSLSRVSLRVIFFLLAEAPLSCRGLRIKRSHHLFFFFTALYLCSISTKLFGSIHSRSIYKQPAYKNIILAPFLKKSFQHRDAHNYIRYSILFNTLDIPFFIHC